jgi:hypothetical protein
MHINTVKSLEFYCKNEILSLKESNFLSRILLLSKSLDYDVDLSVGEALDVKESKYPKIIYLSVSVLDKEKNIVLVNPLDNEHLTDATRILEIDKRERVSFFTWQEDEDFIESLKWIAKELQKLCKSVV